MIHQHDIAARDAYVADERTIRGRQPGRKAQRKRKSVFRRPLDFQHLLVEQIVFGLSDLCQPYSMAAQGIGISHAIVESASGRASDLFEDEHVTYAEFKKTIGDRVLLGVRVCVRLPVSV